MRNSLIKLIYVGAFLSALLVFPACELLEGDGSDGWVNNKDGGTPPLPNLVTTSSAGKTVEVDFTTGSEQFLVVPYSASAKAADAIDFDITITGGSTKTTTHSLRWTPRVPLKKRNYALWLRWQQRLAVERWTRDQAEHAATHRLVPLPGEMNNKIATCTTSAGCQATEVCHNGTCASSITLKVASFSSAGTATIKVRKKGTKAAVLVDTSDTVSDTTVSAILDKYEKVIYPRDVSLFGNPKLTSSGATLSTDRNADGLVWLVITSEVSDKMSAVGFFNAVDFSQTSANSNKADILYIDADATKKLSSVYPILAHEFQHLLSFAVKKYRPEKNGQTGALETLWLDEGLSHMAEGVCGFGGENITLLDQELFTAFEDYSVFFKDDDKGNRTMAMLFVQYLFEQKGGVGYLSSGGITDKGGATFLQALRNPSKQGTAAIDAAYGDHKAAFDKWIATIALDGRGVTSHAAYNYKAPVSDPVTGASIGIGIRGTFKDETGASVTLTGPLEEALTGDTDDSIVNASARFYTLKGKTGKVKVKVTSAGSDFRFAVIKLK